MLGVKMKKHIKILFHILIIMGILISVYNFTIPVIKAEQHAIFGTYEILYNDQGEYIGERCWQDPYNCVVVFAQ